MTIPSLSNEHIGAWHVLDKAPSLPRGGAYWCRHKCGHEQRHRASTLRRVQRGVYVLRCERCAE